MPSQIMVGIVLGLVLAWAYSKFMVPAGAPAFPIIIQYDPKTGFAPGQQLGYAMDRLGVPFNNVNPGR